MGRGLSDLQEWILAKAAEPKLEYPDCDLVTSHVIRDYYGIPLSAGSITDQIFRDVSADEAQARRPAVTRAFSRLESRGLVQRVGNSFWSGICLTDEGRRLANTIMESSPLL